MALHGSPLDPRSQGTNGLIRDSATLVQNVDDVLTILTRQAGLRRRPLNPIKFRQRNWCLFQKNKEGNP